MAELKIKYGSPTAITITLASLAASATVGRAGAEVDNTTNRYVDALVQGQITMNSSGTVTGTVDVYILASLDGTTYDGDTNYSGTDAGYTLAAATTPNLKLAGSFGALATSAARQISFSVAALFGGRMPAWWAPVVINNSGGATLNSTGNSFNYTGITYESV